MKDFSGKDIDWIRVEDEWPPDSIRILVCTSGGHVCFAVWEEAHGYSDDDCLQLHDVVYWSWAPAPPPFLAKPVITNADFVTALARQGHLGKQKP